MGSWKEEGPEDSMVLPNTGTRRARLANLEAPMPSVYVIDGRTERDADVSGRSPQREEDKH